MTDLSYEHALTVSSLLRTKADDDERRAADFDKWTDGSGNYTPATMEWAGAQQAILRDRARSLREFAKAVVVRAVEVSA